jgi:polyisoprenoid-binding protein YceI
MTHQHGQDARDTENSKTLFTRRIIMHRKLLLASLALALLISLGSIARAETTYKIDPVHATVIYKVSHLGISNAYGRFNEPTGTVVIDDDPARSSFMFEVQADKIDTGNPKRDGHLKSPDFFDAKQFPKIEFKSTKVEKDGDKYNVTGDLTMHGVTKSITVPVRKTGEGNGLKPGETRSGWEAQVDLKRSDYGIKGLLGPVGDDVHLTISFEAVKQ